MITVLCVGTTTEIGKTWVGARVLSDLKGRGVRVAACKPVQSFDPSEPGPTDADVLAMATGQHPNDVCPENRWYPLPMAPPIAARRLGLKGFLIADVADGVLWPDGTEVLWVETVGGPLSPIADDGNSADLFQWVFPDVVVLVADAGLGTINAVRLSAIPFAGRRLVVVLNRHDPNDPIHADNAMWLEREGFEVMTEPAALVALLAGLALPERAPKSALVDSPASGRPPAP